MRLSIKAVRAACLFALGFAATTALPSQCQAQQWPVAGCDTGNCNTGNWGSASGYGDDSFSHRFKRDYYRNKMWPQPFRAQDARSILTYFDAQRNKGWQLHNTIGSAMYEPSTGRLTETGKSHLRWVVTHAPQARRVVFVLQGSDQRETAARVEQTQLAISQLLPTGDLPQIYLTNQEPPGSSGIYQTSIQRAMTTSVPSPRLSAAAQPGTP